MPDDANVLAKVVVVFGVINRVPATCTQRLLLLRSCAYLNSLDNLAYRPKLGFKNKCQAQAGFRLVISVSGRSRLQNEALLQL